MSKDIYLPKNSNFKEGDRIALVGRYKDNAETNQILLAPANIDLDPSEIIDKVTVLEKDKTNELYFVLERARIESGYEFNTMFGETVLTVKQHPYSRQTIKINSMYVDSSFDYANIVFVRRGERTIELLPESKYKELKKSGKIIRPAHKVYIGQTVKAIECRFKEHIRQMRCDLKRGKKLTHFYNALNKYGVEHFWVELIEDCEENQLDEKEIYWIDCYDSFYNGYNSTLGGQGKLSQIIIGQQILQYDLNGNFVQMFSNARIAAEQVQVSPSSIRDACIQRRQSSGNYQWRYYTPQFPLKIKPIISRQHGKCKKVSQYNVFGELIQCFNSIQEASNNTGISYTNIQRACHTEGTSKAGGFQWRFSNSKDVPVDISKPAKKPKVFKTQLPVIQYDKEGHYIKEWSTIREAADFLHIRSSLIENVCDNKQKTAGKFKWQYKI